MRTNCRICILIWGIAGIAVLTWALAPVLTPFIAGALLAYVGDPWADRLETRGLPRTVAVIVVFAALFTVLTLAILLLIPLLGRQLTVFALKLPEYLAWLQQHALPMVRETFGLTGGELDLHSLGLALTPYWSEAGGILSHAVRVVGASGGLLLQWLANLVLIPVVTFYLLRDWDILVARVRDLLPRRAEPVVSALVVESDQVLSAFLRGQLLVMLGQGAIYALGLWVVGLEFSLLIGMIAGLISFVPYLGAIVGVAIAMAAGYLQFQEITALLPVLAVFAVGQAIEGMLLTPLLVGDRIGLHPVAVIFAVMVGGQLFGFLGVLVALPVAAVIMVLLRHSHDEYLRSALYGAAEADAPPDPPAGGAV
jgi:predicted PurR-regulated permease PerM